MAIAHLVFGWIDYTLFGGLLGMSLLIGVYFGFFSKQDSTSEYLFGGRTMNYIPVAISILASFLSGITFLGIPTEVYLHGSQYFASVFSALFICLISTYIILPTFYRLRVSSTFEYLEMRYSKTVRTFASVVYIISIFLYIPIVVYVPALAFSQVTGYNIHAITAAFSIVCITYTSMGGVKAVVWTDTIQFIFTIGGLISVLALGIIAIGGVSEFWRLAEEGHRIKFFDMNPSPLKRDTFWAMSIGLTFTMLSRFGLGQKFVQRFLAIPNEADMKKAIIITTSGWGILQVACVIIGLLMYAQYRDCDPLKAHLIERSDQTLPYYVMDIAGHVSGLPGIFLAGLVSSALSTMSASLNTVSGLIYDTCVDRWIPESPKKDALSTNIMKVISVLAGCITIGLIFVVEQLGTIFEVAFSLSSAMEGALLGLFLAGMLLPWIGKIGAFTGGLSSLIIMGWIVGGQQWHILNKRIRFSTLPTSAEACPYPLNETLLQENTTSTSPLPDLTPENEPMILFHIAVLYFTLMGAVMVIVIGGITSHFVSETDLSKVNPECVAPVVLRLLRNKFYTEVPSKETGVELNIVNGIKNEENVFSR
ncbi:hypothetical protein TSAR_014030 [Trichomalopsis sarcophagae]|uniref:Sodium-coupled monocarboxylate transporter 1 n=1 Tax=Trichomalopsis sarcophagae TaxID=543379 RepID=A0A232F205_9HYME|nr:hypothetical protein TSAR_014030 [Trichomalopsis sarcophagae]